MGKTSDSRPSSGMLVAALALVFAFGATAIAAPDTLNRAVSKSKVKKIAKKQAVKQINRLAPSLSVASAGTADKATSADSATTARNASQLGGLFPDSINTANEGSDGGTGCDPPATGELVCASTAIQQPARADVLVLAAGTFWGSAMATGTCVVQLVGSNAPGPSIEIGQQVATHTGSDSGAGFSLPHLFSDVPAGSRTFQLVCDEDTANLRLSFTRIVAVRLSG